MWPKSPSAADRCPSGQRRVGICCHSPENPCLPLLTGLPNCRPAQSFLAWPAGPTCFHTIAGALLLDEQFAVFSESA